MIDMKKPRQDLDLSFARYSEECFTQIYRSLFGDAMLVPMQKHPSLSSTIETKYNYPRP